MAAAVEVRNLRKVFGGVTAVDNISITVEAGQALSLLGSSGCGKTTTLRCIAGLESPSAGEIAIEGTLVAAPARRVSVPAEKRGLGMVFQSYAIWPHMSVFENVAYGLRTRSTAAAEIKRRVARALEQTNLVGLEKRYPSQLSGGQQQRVAVARAIVFEPRVLLMDEPLSNLDAQLREQTRIELRQIQAQLGITTIYVTHDQQEALTISDQVAVMSFGRILQLGTPEEIYNRPAARFVAEFVGKSNLLSGTVEQPDNGTLGSIRLGAKHGGALLRSAIPANYAPGDKVTAVIRPEQWQLVPNAPPPSENEFRGQIKRRIFLGNLIEFHVDVGGENLLVQASPHLNLNEGCNVLLRVDPASVVVIREEEQNG